ncbi:MAG: DUF374 domain-containing protein [Planctomycetota bacterium]
MAGRHPIKALLFRHVLPGPVQMLVQLWAATWRYRVFREHYCRAAMRHCDPVLAGFWHGRLGLLMPYTARPWRGIWTGMISTSLDGELHARVARRMGYRVVRGSSGRGGSRAMVALLRAVREDPGSPLSLAVEGSRGPREQVQAGVPAIAAKAGAWFLPAAAAARPAVVLRSWDRFILPLPFARVNVGFGRPFKIPAAVAAAHPEACRERIARSLQRVQAEVAREVALASVGW